MNEEVLQVTIEDLAAGAPISPDMLRDLLALGSLEIETARTLSQTIGSLTGLHANDAIRATIKDALPEAERGRADNVIRVLLRVNATEISDVLSTLQAWASRKEIRKQVFSDELRDRLKQNLDVLIKEYPAIESRPREANARDHAWTKSTETILSRLEDAAASQDALNETVLFAETAEFEPDQLPRLLDSLEQFISKNRCAGNEKTIVSLGAAIRKFAMNMPEDRFDKYANWLMPGETAYLDHDVELELVQGVSSRFAYSPVSIDVAPNQLINTLQEIASQYASPRFIVQKNYAATAVEATVALVLLRIFTDSTGEAKRLMETVSENHPWFHELVRDQLQETAEHMASRDRSLSEAVSQAVVV